MMKTFFMIKHCPPTVNAYAEIFEVMNTTWTPSKSQSRQVEEWQRAWRAKTSWAKWALNLWMRRHHFHEPYIHTCLRTIPLVVCRKSSDEENISHHSKVQLKNWSVGYLKVGMLLWTEKSKNEGIVRSLQVLYWLSVPTFMSRWILSKKQLSFK